MGYKGISLILFFVFTVSSVSAAPLQKIEIVNAVARNAICTDGSPAIYWFRAGSGSGAKRWIISLEGGGFCNTPGCDGFNSYVLSSNATSGTIVFDVGLFSDSAVENPDFYNSNMVYVHYCSADLWSGNRFEPSGSRPLHFRGRTIFSALITDLKNRTGSNLLMPNTEVLLTGQSAGGTGVMVHLDWLAKQLPKARVKGFNDSGWFPAKSAAVSPAFENQIAQGIPMWGAKANLKCQQANPSKLSKCFLSTVYEYLTTPLFIVESQWDWIFIANPADPGAPEFAKAVRDSLIPVQGAFSPRVFRHVLSTGRLFTASKVDNVSLKDTLGNWFFERAGKMKAIQK